MLTMVREVFMAMILKEPLSAHIWLAHGAGVL